MLLRNIVKFSYFINDHQSSLMLDVSNKISTLKYIIAQSTNIVIDEYDLYYAKNLVDEKEDCFLYELIKRDNCPILFLKKKGKLMINLGKLKSQS
jgi:hypothetical protein